MLRFKMVKVRLARWGRKKLPFYKIVVAHSRTQRDGKFIEQLGIYDPLIKTDNMINKFKLNLERYNYWIKVGAQPSEKIAKIVNLINQ